MEEELLVRTSHTHALFRNINGSVYNIIKETLHATQLSATIFQFRRTRNGRAALFALKSKHAGLDVWEKIIKEAEEFLMNQTWTGTTGITLANHMTKHQK